MNFTLRPGLPSITQLVTLLQRYRKDGEKPLISNLAKNGNSIYLFSFLADQQRRSRNS